MKSPLQSGTIQEHVELASTQTQANDLVALGQSAGIGAVLAHQQTQGFGRFNRDWHSRQGESLTLSLIFHDYANHPKPWLIGMAVGLAAAGASHARISWPNDLVLSGKKVGGLITHVIKNPDGALIPVVGLGLNLAVKEFPEALQHRAANIPGHKQPQEILAALDQQLQLLPEPNNWSDLKTIWSMFDDTPGKKYKLPNGDLADAIGIGPDGELLCAVDGETMSVLAAEAWFGQSSSS